MPLSRCHRPVADLGPPDRGEGRYLVPVQIAVPRVQVFGVLLVATDAGNLQVWYGWNGEIRVNAGM